jgi:hypothetical protein
MALGRIQHFRRIDVSGVPVAGDLKEGEIAINLTDQKMWTLNRSGVVVPVSLSELLDEQVTGLWNFANSGDGGLLEYDLTIGDTATPDYGILRIGDSILGRTSHTASDGAPAYNLNGAFILQNPSGPVTGDIEFGFLDSAGLLRLGLPKSAVGNATYNPRSMLIAGPAIADSDVVTVGYWQGQGIFHNLVCDTGGSGADLGVQNDLEVEGEIFVDTILESTIAAGVTIDGVLIKDSLIGATYLTGTMAEFDAALSDGDFMYIGDAPTAHTHDHLTELTNVGVNTHAQIDTHIADATLHFTEASIDHTAITNIGTNTHAQIDTHIAAVTGNPHQVAWSELTGSQPAPISHSHGQGDITNGYVDLSTAQSVGGLKTFTSTSGIINSTGATPPYFGGVTTATTSWGAFEIDGPGNVIGGMYIDMATATFRTELWANGNTLIDLYGTGATRVGDISFKSNNVERLFWDLSATNWDFSGTNVVDVGTLTANGLVADTAGLSFGSQGAASTTDLSKHLRLYGTGYGINVTSGDINVVRGSTLHTTFDAGALDLHSNTIVDAGSITFNGDTDALDTYEADTWTPVVTDGTTTISTSTAAGSYTRIGRLVHFNGRIIVSNLNGATGSVRITNLPFTVASGSAGLSPVHVGYAKNLNITAGQNVAGYASNSSTNLIFQIWDATSGTSNLAASKLDNGAAAG